jgi:hypothetical protein
LCGALSLFVHFTVCPTFAVIAFGLNAMFCITTATDPPLAGGVLGAGVLVAGAAGVEAAALLLELELELELEPQPARITTSGRVASSLFMAGSL